MKTRSNSGSKFCWHNLASPQSSFPENKVQRVSALRGFWDLKKTALREIRVNRTVGDPLLTSKSPTCAYKNCGSGIRGSENRISGGPLVPEFAIVQNVLTYINMFIPVQFKELQAYLE